MRLAFLGGLCATFSAAGATPVITSALTASAKVGTPFTYQITATNSPTYFGAIGLPSGLTANFYTGLISGTPTVSGTFSVTLEASTDFGNTNGTATLSIVCAAATPVITSPLATEYAAVRLPFFYSIKATNLPTSFNATGLPTGLSVNTFEGYIQGTPTATGTFSVTLSATDAYGETGTATLTLLIGNLPEVADGYTTAIVGQPFTYQVTATNSPTSFSTTDLPPGLTINPSTGLISGTPAGSAGSQYYVGLEASNNFGSEYGMLTINLIAASSSPPAITSALTATAAVGQAFSYQIAATNSPASYGATGLPSGLSVNASTGLISGTPTGSTGVYSVTISATNLAGTGSATLPITISATAPNPPVITSSLTATAVYEQAFSYQISATNSPTSYGATGLPSGLTLNTTTGVISGTTNTIAWQLWPVTLSATNSSGIATATLNLSVSGPNPTITSSLTVTGTFGQSFSYQIAATNSPASYSATALPSGLSINTATGLILGTLASSPGTYSVVISATNATGTGTARLALTIAASSATGPLPSFTNSTGVVATIGQSLSYQITATNGPTSYGATGLPSGLSINTATGVISGTTTGSAGNYSVTITATNASGTASTTLTIFVGSAPAITSALAETVPLGAPFAYQITSTVARSTFTATGLPAGLSVNSTTGVISGTPSGNPGVYAVTISAIDPWGVNTATLTLTITSAASNPPSVTSDLSETAWVGQPFSYQITGSNSPTSYNATGLPSGLSVNTSTGMILGTPNGSAGNYNVTLTASNGSGGGSATLSLSLSASLSSTFTPYTFSTYVGQTGSGSANGLGTAAQFSNPGGIAVDSAGDVYVADSGNDTIRKITPGGVVTTFAGSPGIPGNADGTGTAARFNSPADVTVDSAGNIYVADSGNDEIRKITPGGVVTTLAGSSGSVRSADGTGTAARFSIPSGIVVDGNGNVYVADFGDDTILTITPGGVVTTLAGSPGNFGSADGTGSAAQFFGPSGVAIDGNGNVFVADDYNDTIRKIAPGGIVTTLAGFPGSPGFADGTGNAARFNGPGAIALGANGNLYVADWGNATIREVTPAGVVTTIGGSPGDFGSANGAGSAAQFDGPSGVAVDASGNVYVAEANNSEIRLGVALGQGPAITSQPQSMSATVGGSFALSVTATSSLSMSYQWFLNGTAMASQTSSMYTVANATAANAGSYTVVVSDSNGSVTSSVATVTVSAATTSSTTTGQAPAASSGGGGGGAPSLWFYSALAVLAGLKTALDRRKSSRTSRCPCASRRD